MICPHILFLTDLYQHITSDPPSSNISTMCLVIVFLIAIQHATCLQISGSPPDTSVPTGSGRSLFFKYPMVMTSSDFNFTAQ